MPRTRKRRFIDPKRSVTFEVVARSQVDPLAVDETAPRNVLMEKRTRSIVETDHEPQPGLSPEKRQREQQKYGVYFDDDYNYLQHLRDVRLVGGDLKKIVRVDVDGAQVEIQPDTDEEEADDTELRGSCSGPKAPQISLPSSVFASHVEERVGHLHKGLTHTGPRPEWDPDVIAALDDDNLDVGDEELEDDFVALASGGAECIEDLGAGDEELSTRRFYFTERELETVRDEDDKSDDSRGMFADSEDDAADSTDNEDHDDVGDMSGKRFAKEETRSRFTLYSLSSSVMTRTGGLKTLDEQFEQMFEREYEDKDVGALDGEEIEGRIPVKSDIVEKLANQYEEGIRLTKGYTAIGEPDEEVKGRVLKSLEQGEEVEELNLVDNDPARDAQKWDCESVLSTYSSIYNRPKLIEMPRKADSSSKLVLGSRGLPVEETGLTKRALKQLDGGFVKADDYAKSVCSRASTVSIARAKDETPEERKARKQQVKEFRRERRLEKKANVMAFKAEECRQKVQDLNVRNNMRGIKLL